MDLPWYACVRMADQTKSAPPEGQMTAEDVARFVADGKTTAETVEGWRRSGALKAVSNVGGQWLYRMQDVQAFLR